MTEGPFYMVITFKSGAQIRAKVTGYTIGRNLVTKELQTVEWTTADDSETTIRYFDMDEVVAVHTEWIPAVDAPPRAPYAVGPPDPGER